MKLPITDEFLWDLYEFYEASSNFLDDFSQLSNISPTYIPELAKAKQIYENKKARTRFSQFIYYLKKQGYIKIKSLQEKDAIILTEQGLKKALKAKRGNKRLKKRKDNKIIMVLYDIPKKKKGERDILRSHLKNLGFELFQKSVWASPYDVLDDIKQIIAEQKLEKYTDIFLTEQIKIKTDQTKNQS